MLKLQLILLMQIHDSNVFKEAASRPFSESGFSAGLKLVANSEQLGEEKAPIQSLEN